MLPLLVLLLAMTAELAAQTPAPPPGSQPAPPPATQPGAASDRVPVPEPTAQALAYHRSGNVLWVLQHGVGTGRARRSSVDRLLGAHARLGAAPIGRKWFFAVAVYWVIFTMAYHRCRSATRLLRKLRARSTPTACRTRRSASGPAIRSPAWRSRWSSAALVLWVPYLLLRKSPRRWWLYTSALAVPFIILIVLVQPIWIDPLFNRFGPMKDKSLEAEILQLADRAGIEGGRVFEVAKSEDTKALNAYVNGFGATKRIVLWDTILKALDRPQLLVVMGHEMGHYVLGHVWKLIGILAVDDHPRLALRRAPAVGRADRPLTARRFGFTLAGDVASLPLDAAAVQRAFRSSPTR